MRLWAVLDLTDAGCPTGSELDRVSVVLDVDRGRVEREARQLNETHDNAHFRVYAIVPADGG